MAIRDNKTSPMNQKKINARDGQPTFDEQVVRLEEDLRRLKVEFDIYFNGASKRPPYDTKNRVETIIKRLAEERSVSYVQRYQYNSLVARYSSFREMWRRTMQDREEGRDAAASAQAAQALRQHAKAMTNEPPTASSFVCADVRGDVKTVRDLYSALIEAKKQCGESSDDMSFARFHRLISEQTESLKDRLHCERIKFSVKVNDGQVSFKAEAG